MSPWVSLCSIPYSKWHTGCQSQVSAFSGASWSSECVQISHWQNLACCWGPFVFLNKVNSFFKKCTSFKLQGAYNFRNQKSEFVFYSVHYFIQLLVCALSFFSVPIYRNTVFYKLGVSLSSLSLSVCAVNICIYAYLWKGERTHCVQVCGGQKFILGVSFLLIFTLLFETLSLLSWICTSLIHYLVATLITGSRDPPVSISRAPGVQEQTMWSLWKRTGCFSLKTEADSPGEYFILFL